MTFLRSGTEVSFVNRRSARQQAHHAPIKRRHQQLTKFTLKANNTKSQSKSPDKNSRRAQNARYLRQALAYQRATGDSAKVLREKRLWLQAEYLAHRISGKEYRELKDLYSKRNIGKPKNRLPKASNLSNAAKLANQRLDEFFSQRLDANHSASAIGVSSGHVSSDADEMPSNADEIPSNADEMPSAARITIDGGSHTDNPADDGNANEDPLIGATDLVAGEGVKLEVDTETEHEGPSTRDYISHADHVNTAEENDAAARQRLRELNIEIADYSTANLAAGGVGNDEEEVEIKQEEADE